MVKIFLVPYHPAEREIADFLSDELKASLSRRGHSLEIVPVPETIDMNSTARRFLNKGQKVSIEELEQAASEFVQNLATANPGSFVIELHSGPVLNCKLKKKTSHLTVRFNSKSDNAYFPFDVFLQKRMKDHNVYQLEVGAKYVASPPDVTRLSDSVKAYWNKQYFLEHADLKKTRALNYLSPQLIARIAHLIDTVIRTQTGLYKTSKGTPFKDKKELAKLREQKRRARLGRKFQR